MSGLFFVANCCRESKLVDGVVERVPSKRGAFDAGGHYRDLSVVDKEAVAE